MNITNKTFTLWKVPCKGLINKVLKRIQKFSALASKQQRIFTINI